MMPSSNLLKANLKIVVDTNLFISVFVFRGQMVRTIFELVMDNILAMYVSTALKQELSTKLKYFGVSGKVQDEVMLFIDEKRISVDPGIIINESRDKEDNFLLELSEAVHADYLLTRDEDLLIFKRRRETKIIMPEAFFYRC